MKSGAESSGKAPQDKNSRPRGNWKFRIWQRGIFTVSQYRAQLRSIDAETRRSRENIAFDGCTIITLSRCRRWPSLWLFNRRRVYRKLIENRDTASSGTGLNKLWMKPIRPIWRYIASANIHAAYMYMPHCSRKVLSLPHRRRPSGLREQSWRKLRNTRNTLDCDQSNYSSRSRIVFSHIPIESGQTGISAIRSADLENPTVEPNMKWIGWPLAEIWPFEISPNVRLVGWSVAGRSVVNIYFFLHWSHIGYSSSLR